MPIKLHSSIFVHAGEWLKTQIVEPHGITTKQLATHFGVSRQALSTLFNGHTSLTADMALRFEKAFGIDAVTMLRMQASYDLAQAREHAQGIKIAPLAKAE